MYLGMPAMVWPELHLVRRARLGISKVIAVFLQAPSGPIAMDLRQGIAEYDEVDERDGESRRNADPAKDDAG
jgi:hypothetical protein